MRIPRDLLEQKLEALKLVMPSLVADAPPGQGRAEFAKLSEELLQQCMPEDEDYALARLDAIRQQLGIPGR